MPDVLLDPNSYVAHPHLPAPISFFRPLRHFAFSLGFVSPRARYYVVIRVRGRPTVFRAAKARKSPRGLPRCDAITVAIADR
jgi:hypothetical protein